MNHIPALCEITIFISLLAVVACLWLWGRKKEER